MITRSNQATIVQFMKRTPERVESGDFPRTWTDEMIEYCYHIIAFRCNKESRQGRPSPVRCIETGEIFENSVEASRSVGLNIRAVTNAIHRNCSAGGYYWEYVED